MEKHFLQYLLYITLVEFRADAYEAGNKRQFWLADLLHNIPLKLNSVDDVHETYLNLLENVKSLGLDDWLNARMKEFYSRHPEFDNES